MGVLRKFVLTAAITPNLFPLLRKRSMPSIFPARTTSVKLCSEVFVRSGTRKPRRFISFLDAYGGFIAEATRLRKVWEQPDQVGK